MVDVAVFAEMARAPGFDIDVIVTPADSYWTVFGSSLSASALVDAYPPAKVWR